MVLLSVQAFSLSTLSLYNKEFCIVLWFGFSKNFLELPFVERKSFFGKKGTYNGSGKAARARSPWLYTAGLFLPSPCPRALDTTTLFLLPSATMAHRKVHSRATRLFNCVTIVSYLWKKHKAVQQLLFPLVLCKYSNFLLACVRALKPCLLLLYAMFCVA